MDIERVQREIRRSGLDGWLFYDFHNRDPISYRILGLDPKVFTSRRWFYFVPSTGTPVRLVSRVEPSRLDSLPGEKVLYLSWQDLKKALENLLRGKTVAMQYSPEGAVPYISLVDAGTVELIRASGATIVSSADLIQVFEACLDQKAYETHLEASRRIHAIKDDAFSFISRSLADGLPITEYDVQQFILRRFEEEGLDCKGEWPIVAANEHASDPHFLPTPENTFPIRPNDTILIDLWAKLKGEGTIFADITWCAFAGQTPPPEYVRIFDVVRRARDHAVSFIQSRLSQGLPCRGFEVDEACRQVVRAAGYGDYFIHRTGHSIGTEVHGNGVTLDNLETKDERRLLPGSLFSIEPGIYLPGRMAVRTEINCFIHPDGRLEITGPLQDRLILL